VKTKAKNIKTPVQVHKAFRLDSKTTETALKFLIKKFYTKNFVYDFTKLWSFSGKGYKFLLGSFPVRTVSIRNEKVPFSTYWNEVAHYLQKPDAS
jgi:hypothetical protein